MSNLRTSTRTRFGAPVSLLAITPCRFRHFDCSRGAVLEVLNQFYSRWIAQVNLRHALQTQSMCDCSCQIGNACATRGVGLCSASSWKGFHSLQQSTPQLSCGRVKYIHRTRGVGGKRAYSAGVQRLRDGNHTVPTRPSNPRSASLPMTSVSVWQACCPSLRHLCRFDASASTFLPLLCPEETGKNPIHHAVRNLLGHIQSHTRPKSSPAPQEALYVVSTTNSCCELSFEVSRHKNNPSTQNGRSIQC